MRKTISGGMSKPSSERAWHVYIVRCSDETLYTGVTTDIDHRTALHNSGRASRYTRGRAPVRVVYREQQPTRSAALRRESAIKAMTRREKEALIRLDPLG